MSRVAPIVYGDAAHSIAFWSSDDKLPLQHEHRQYYPEELFPSEKIWLPAVLEPVRQAYLVLPPPPLELYLPEEPLPEDATIARLIGKKPDVPGVWREIYVYRARRMVQVYRVESHGRRYYRSLEYASDARFSLASIQPCTKNRQQPWPEWERHGAGHPYANSWDASRSAVITREATVAENLSMGEETYVPGRLLSGLLPAALTERFTFWQVSTASDGTVVQVALHHFEC